MKIPGFKSGKKKLKQVISKYEQQISTLTVDHLRKLHKLTLEKDQAEQKLAIQQNDYESWKTNTGHGIERMKNEYGTLQKEKKKTENDLIEKNQKILVLEESKKNQQTAIERQEREIKTIQKEIQQERQNNFKIEQEINALRRASTTSTNQLTLKDKQIEKMQKELKNFEENTNRKVQELLTIQKDKELAVKEITSKNREIGLIIASKKEDEQKISKKEQELCKIREESMKKDEMIEEISQQIKKMEKLNQQEIEKIKAKYLAEISDVEEKVQAATEKNKVYLMKLGEKEIESKELTEKLNQINQDFKEKQKEYEQEVEILGTNSALSSLIHPFRFLGDTIVRENICLMLVCVTKKNRKLLRHGEKVGFFRIFQFSELSIKCCAKKMKKYLFYLNRTDFMNILSVPHDHLESQNNFI